MTRRLIFSTVRTGIVLTLLASAAGAANPPTGFQETIVFSGLSNPTQVRFLPDGRVLVAEKSGLIKMFASLTATTPTIVADLRTNVHNFWDRGLLGLAVDPDFANNGYIYVNYAYDAAIGGTAPRWGTPGNSSDGCPTPPGATTDGCVVSNRVSRMQIVNGVAGPEQVLIEDWCQQFPSHSAGTLAFGADGKLYVTGGEGASFNFVDYGQSGGTSGTPPPVPKNPCGDPPAGVGGTEAPPSAEGGALRSQSLRRPAGEPVLLSGALLRVDPATGAAPPDNPLFGSSDANAQRIVGFGLRNPFRFTIKPGTNEVYIGDVGWNTWEEINAVPNPLDPSVRNFGWPGYEGAAPHAGYQNAGLAQCSTLYSAGTATPPLYTYNHTASVVAGDGCTTGSSSIGGMAFYDGGDYPSNYQGALFFSDYSRKCIWVMFPDANGNPDPTNRLAWKSAAAGPVDIQTGPNGDIFYVDFDGGTVRRYSYLGPTAIATASPDSGAPPLTVQFDGTSSQPGSPDDTITFAWDLDGDGQFDDATDPAPLFVYQAAGSYTARLKVTDNHNISTVSDPLTINVDTHAPTAFITQPAGNLTWRVGDTISFKGHANDPQQGQLPASAMTWEVLIHHCPSNCHTHVYQTFEGVDQGSFPAPDHEYPSYLELRLTAVDSSGLSSTASENLDPETVDLTFQSSPAGLQLSVGSTTATTPFTETVIIGSQNSVSAPSPQGSFVFQSWSDAGAQTHNITAPDTPATYTATYTSPTGLPPPWTDADIGNVVVAGSASYSVGTFTDRGAGADIWGANDAFHYIFQPISSDTTIVAKVATLQNTSTWAKAGVMIRESLAPNARNAFMAVTPGNGLTFQRRRQPGGTSVATAGGPGVVPYWVKLERSGSTFTAWTSTNGTSWTLVGSDTVSMSSNAYVGLAVTSHTTTKRTTSTFTNVSVTGGPSNSPPSVSITAPAEGATYTAPATVSISASALDTDGTVAQVDFYQGGFLLGSDTTAPFGFSWTNAAAGTYTLTARATDDLGAVTTSAAVHITVNPGANTPPSVSITAPTAGASFPAPANITINADASDDGTVTKVEFFNGAALLGSDTTAPYSFAWNNVAGGNYTLTAKATDNLGATTTSAPVGITVTTSGVPAPWVDQDIGATGLSGSATFASGTFTIKASGADIAGANDAFHYVYQAVSGDTTIVARVATLLNTNAWAKSGVMIRETLAPNSKNAMMAITTANGFTFQRRVTTGGSTSATSGGAGTAPKWLKLVRSGDTLTGYQSADGLNWTQVGSTTISMTADVYVGLAVTSHNNSSRTTSTVGSVTVTQP